MHHLGPTDWLQAANRKINLLEGPSVIHAREAVDPYTSQYVAVYWGEEVAEW